MTRERSPSSQTVEARTLPQLSAVILEDLTELSLAEVGRACSVHVDCIVELVQEGVLSPIGREPHRWRFSGIHLRRASVALRLQRDLGVNFAGAALVLQLLDDIDDLRARIRVLGD